MPRKLATEVWVEGYKDPYVLLLDLPSLIGMLEDTKRTFVQVMSWSGDVAIRRDRVVCLVPSSYYCIHKQLLSVSCPGCEAESESQQDTGRPGFNSSKPST